jgi:energy-coupling factor transport system substrate-specific component
MSQPPRHFFSLHEVLIMAALAALGGVSGSAVSWVGASLHAVTGIPGGLQFMAGIHVLWLVLAVGLVRKPGAATITGVLKGAVELLSGNPHGLLVLLMSGLGGLAVDLVWLVMARRDHLMTYALAGGFGAASNLVVFKIIYSLPSSRAVSAGLGALTIVAFASGALLAGLLGWSLMDALRRAGVAGAQGPARTGQPGIRTWIGAGLVAAIAVLLGMGVYFGGAKKDDKPPRSAAATSAETGPTETSP